jgi:hypothetical protein
MQLKKSVLFLITLVVGMAILLSVNVFSEQKGAEAPSLYPNAALKKLPKNTIPSSL